MAGNSGPKTKSDCRISLEINSSGGINIIIKSKVKQFFEDHYSSIIRGSIKKYGIPHCTVILEDTGALDYVILARLEVVLAKATGKDVKLLPTAAPSRKI